MCKETRIIKTCESLSQDILNLREGKLDLRTASAICKHVNAIVKMENIILQHNRIEERITRYK